MSHAEHKVLVVSTSDTGGGAARAAYRIRQAVNGQQIHSRMLVKTKLSSDADVLTVEDFNRPNILKKVFRYIQHKIKNKIQHYRWSKYPRREDVFMSDLRSSPTYNALQEIEYDILHLHWVNLRFLDLKELKKVNRPLVWTLHDCWAFTGICHYFYDCEKYKITCGNCPFLHSNKEKDLSFSVWKAKKKLYEGLNLHIVTPSRWLAAAAKESALFSKFPVTVIPNPVDTELFKPEDKKMAREKLGLYAYKRYIIYGAVNALTDKNKGFQHLLSALQLIEKQRDAKDLELLVFGVNAPLNELKTNIPVRYLGYISSEKEMAAVYPAADVMVVPSLSENLSNIIMESLSCGTPVAAFDIGGNSDMIEHKQNGYLSEEQNNEDLARGILWCLEHNTDNKLSANARQKVETCFSSGKVGEMYADLYKQIAL